MNNPIIALYNNFDCNVLPLTDKEIVYANYLRDSIEAIKISSFEFFLHTYNIEICNGNWYTFKRIIELPYNNESTILLDTFNLIDGNLDNYSDEGKIKFIMLLIKYNIDIYPIYDEILKDRLDDTPELSPKEIKFLRILYQLLDSKNYNLLKETLKNFSKKNKDLLKKILNTCFDGNHLLIYIASDNDDFLNDNNSYVNLLAEYGANVIPLIDSIYESNYDDEGVIEDFVNLEEYIDFNSEELKTNSRIRLRSINIGKYLLRKEDDDSKELLLVKETNITEKIDFDDIQNKNNFIKWSCIHDNGGALRMLRKRDII